MQIIENYKTKRLIFSLIWCFFLIRLTGLIIFDFENLLRTFIDLMSLCIFFGLVIYTSLIFFIKKKISKITFLIIYPIIGVVGYYINGFTNDFQEKFLIHHFVTISSVFLYFSLIQSDRIFDYKFHENLLKISLVFFIFFFFFNVLPPVVAKIYYYENLRLTSEIVVKFFGNEIVFYQNINGQTKFMLIMFVLCFFLFKKFLFIKKNIAHLFYSLSILLVVIIFLTQSRLNILAAFVFSIFFLFMIKNLSLRKKSIYFLLILITPIIVFNFYTEKNDNRFLNKKNNISSTLIEDKFKSENFTNIQNDLNEQLLNLLIIYKEDLNTDSKKDLNTDSKKDLNLVTKDLILIFKNYKFYKNKILFNKTSSLHEDYLIYDDLYNMINDNFNKNGTIKSLLSNKEIDENKEIKLLKNLIKKKRDSYKSLILNSCSDKLRFIDILITGRLCGWQILWNSITTKELILGKGFFGDQVFLRPLEKISSNSFVNIFYNAGIISLIICIIILIIFFTKFFKIKNLNNENLYFSLSHYLILYFLFRSIFEDTLAFVSIDFLLFSLCFSLISQKYKEKNN